MYHQTYGSTRAERARRLAHNIPPPYTPAPRVGRYTAVQPHAQFTDEYRYVEYVTVLRRPFVVVRSQKFSARYRKYYKVFVHGSLRAGNTRGWTCTCEDSARRCKHILAVLLKYRPLRI